MSNPTGEGAPPDSATEQKAPSAAENKPRLARIVCWAARLTSIPVFALLLISLLPALASFSVSAQDDKIIAVGLCGIAAGFIAGWRWAGIGGLLTLASVAAIVSQEEGAFSADPFSVAFGLQAVLFLISWVLNASPAPGSASPRLRWLKAAAGAALVVATAAGAMLILRGPPPVPVSRQEEAYVGMWDNGAGFRMEISSDGRVKISQDKDAKIEPCNTPVIPGGSGEFIAEFRDNRLKLSGGVLGQTKVYQVDRRPFNQGKQTRMVLNGSDPYQRGSGMVMFKKDGQAATTPKPPAKIRPS